MVRIAELWHRRKDRRAAVNQQLADADAEQPSRLDRWDREEWTDEQTDKLQEPGEWGAS